MDDRQCRYCDGKIEGDDYLILNESVYCINCATTCGDCGEVRLTDEIIMVSNGSTYCSDCATFCERCSDGTHRDDVCSVDDEAWCSDCRDNYSFYCENCESNCSGDRYYASGTSYCESCYGDCTWYCDDCDESFHSDDPCNCDGSEGERNDCCSSRGFIHDYRCKPRLDFKGQSKTGLYLGFELEIELPDVQRGAEYASVALDGIANLKHDGSIGSGFEIVTQPHTHSMYRDHSARLWNTIETLRTDHKARSWDTDTCGLHIHISRKGFNGGAHMHRFIALVYHNAPHMIKFAGRKSKFARFNDVYTFDQYDRPVFSLKHKVGNPNLNSSERYSAVNTQNENTIELRFFRGTMNKSGVLSALDLAQAMVEYTRELRLDDVKLGALQWEWFADYVRSNNGLYPDLYSRLDTIPTIDIDNKPVVNA